MFGPNKVSKSLVDAVSQIMQIDEAQSEKVPTASGMKVYGHRYGDSAKARRDQTKSSVDAIKGPKDKDLMKKDDAEEKKTRGQYDEEIELAEDGEDCVTKPQAKNIAKKEVKHHNKTMHHGQKDTTKEETEVMSFKDRLLERAMTDAESKKKEKIVMSMKDKQSYFKKKYGKRWKEVMYATATKQAMKEEMSTEEQDLDEEESGLRMAAHAAARDGKKMFSFQGKTYPVKVKKEELAKEEVEELEEKNESHTHAAHYENEKGEWTGMNLFAAKDDEDAIKQAHAKCKEGCKLSRVERHIAVKEEVEIEESMADEHGIGRDIVDKKQKMATASNTGKGKPLHNVAKGLKAFLKGKKEPMESVNVEGEIIDEVASTDMLRGRVYQDRPEHNGHKSSKVDLSDADEELPQGKMEKPMSTKARSSIQAHDGLPQKVDNLDTKYGTPNSFAVHTEAKDPETSDAWGGQANFVTNANTSSDEPKKKELSEVSVDEKVIAGVGGWKKSPGKDGVVTDKSGAKHTPMSRAKDLARMAFKKVQKETLGIAPNNQTGV